MSKKKKTPKQSTEARTPVKRRKSKDGGTRETVESIAIAFALAFLFKTFQAEAYVIPTGSMAPTLYGRHKELTCPSCRYHFQIGASTELDDSTGTIGPGRRIEATLCPNCRREVDALDAPVFNGDRIIVNKQVSAYERFDVVVFKNPEEGHVNYIKRLVGLPGETIRIRQGNLWMRRGENDRWQMLRKEDPEVQKDIQLLVHDDRYPAHDLLAAGWPERWAPCVQQEGDTAIAGWLESSNAWTCDRESRSYTADGQDAEWQWLRYRHIIPNEQDWNDVDDGRTPVSPNASLISDYCGFNVANVGNVNRGTWQDSFMSDAYWVGDLTLNCTLDIARVDENAAIQLELVEGADRFQCVIHPNDGVVEMTRVNHQTDQDGERPNVLASAKTVIQEPGEYQVAFANVDNRLLLWINDDLVEFDEPVIIDQNFVDALTNRPGEADSVPCGIAVRNMNVTVSDLVVQRDIYYRNDAYQFSPDQGITSYYSRDPTSGSQEVSRPQALHRKLDDPEAWSATYTEEARTAHDRFGQYSEYQLADDEYLMFGDNSPRSKDSRLFDYFNRPRWGADGHRYAVKEKDLIGKALYVFWPHGIPFLNDGQGFTVTRHRQQQYNPSTNQVTSQSIDYPKYRFPFYPDVSRMKKIR